MASGTIYGTTSNGSIQARIVWSSTSDFDTNTSTVKATLSYRKNSSYDAATYSREFDGSITINGNGKTLTIRRAANNRIYLYSGAGWVEMGSHTVVVSHNTDGTKSIAIAATGGMYGTSFTSTTLSQSVALDSIPRQATITGAPNFNDTSSPTITYSNPAGNKVDSLKACISLDGSADDISYRDISKTDNTYTFILTQADKNILLNATKTANSRKVYFYIQTVIGDKTYRSRLERTFSVINAAPIISNVMIQDIDSATLTLTGDANAMIKYHSNATFMYSARAMKNTTISKYSIVCGGKSSTETSGTLNNIESGKFVITITDARGNSTSQTINKTLIQYIKLTCSMAAAAPTTDGEMTITATGNYFNGTFGAVANALLVEYRLKENDGDWGAWTATTATLNGNKYSAPATITGLNYKSSYRVQMRATDKISTISSAAKTVKTTPIFDWGADDFAFNVPVDFRAGFTNSNKVLWSGSYYMTAGQTANLNDAISNQASGIVLVFSRYDITNSEPMNEHFSYHFVPKIMIELHADKGSVFNMATSNQSYYACKYLYIDDTAIRGHANNDLIETGNSGISINNNRFVLRYVIGV